jgi:hypothetical protein
LVDDLITFSIKNMHKYRKSERGKILFQALYVSNNDYITEKKTAIPLYMQCVIILASIACIAHGLLCSHPVE